MRRNSQRYARKSLKTEECSSPDTRGLFPNHCMICKKKSCYESERKTPDPCKGCYKVGRKYREMLTAVEDVDLIAKEFQRHEYCYREYMHIESLMSKERMSPALFQLFFNKLLLPSDSHHAIRETASCLGDSFCHDVINALSNGTFIMLKHVLICNPVVTFKISLSYGCPHCTGGLYVYAEGGKVARAWA